jgi:glycosyltransferase involved in cell wall biosynthesis
MVLIMSSTPQPSNSSRPDKAPSSGDASRPDDSPSPSDPVLCIVPAHNEGSRVGAVVRALIGQGLPVLVVDDGSSDDTVDAARAAGARVLSLTPNRGKGAALKAAFRYALDEVPQPGIACAQPRRSEDARPGSETDLANAEPGREISLANAANPAAAEGWAAFLTLDGDGQHDPAEAQGLIRTWSATGADLVVGARDYRSMPPVRRFTNSVSRVFFSWAVGERILDNQSGYRLRTRRLAEATLASPEEGFAFEVEEIAICVGRGYGLAWLPIKTIYGTEVSDIKPWSHFLGFVRVTARARRRVGEERRASAM